MNVIGIDFGTSYSSVAVIEDGKPSAVKTATAVGAFGDNFSMPSTVYVEESGNILVGQAAEIKRKLNPERYKSEFKRDLGQTTPYLLGGKSLLPEDLCVEILTHFLSAVQLRLGAPVDKAVITHPAHFGAHKQELIRLAALKAGSSQVELMDEPTAAAIYYASKQSLRDGEKLLVYDLGGGTFDVALIRKEGSGFVPLTQPLGIEQCGGADFNQFILEDIRGRFEEKLNGLMDNAHIPERVKISFWSDLVSVSLNIKHMLSVSETAEERVNIPGDYEDNIYSLNRQKFQGLISNLVELTCKKAEQIVKNAGLSMRDIDRVLLVGGSTRIPMIEEALARLTGRPIHRDADPELAVCFGAAIASAYGSAQPEAAGASAGASAEAVAAARIAEAEQGDAEAKFRLAECYFHGDGEQISVDMAEALRWYLKAAEIGYAPAQRSVGPMYAAGDGVEQNEREGLRWLLMAANQGDAQAQYQVGYMYGEGQGVPMDELEAIMWVRKAAFQGHVHAQLLLAGAYCAGEGVSQDYQEGAKWMRLAAEQGNPDAQNGLGGLYNQGLGVPQSMEEALKWCRLAAGQGHAQAAYNVGYAYENGQGVAENTKEAHRMYRIAAELGEANAQNKLALMYDEGNGGVQQNKAEAIKWYRAAAEQGHTVACCNLGTSYEEGDGVPENKQEAFRWFMIAAEAGEAMAQNKVALMYDEGIGVAVNKKEAVRWYRAAAEQGHQVSQYNLGVCYEIGEGVAKNLQEAAQWYHVAAEQGHALAQVRLGSMYDNGVGVPQNKLEAVKLYYQAAEQGYHLGQFNLGVCYEIGDGVAKNKEEAIRWYRMAADQGYDKAKQRMENLQKSWIDRLFS